MNLFYKFLEALYSIGNNSFEDDKTFSLEFEFDSRIMDFINYTTFLEFRKYFDKYISFYVCKDLINQQNLFGYLDDEDEFKSEVAKINSKYNFKLYIEKRNFISNKLQVDANVIYFVEKEPFKQYMNEEISIIEKNIFSKSKVNIFILGDCEEYFYNDYYIVTNLNREDFNKEINEFLRNAKICTDDNKIKKRNQQCNWVDGSHYISPETYYIDLTNKKFIIDEDIKQLIFKITSDLVIPFVGNFTGYTSNIYHSIINGNKRIEIQYNLLSEVYTEEAYENFYNLYIWIYEDATFDKLNICRNVISILVTAKCQGSEYKLLIENSDWLIKSVQGNFSKFLQSNIEKFFSEQSNAIKKLNEDITGINSQVSELTKLSIANITSFLGTAIAAVIGYIAKGDIQFIKILAFVYLCYLAVNSIFNLPISIIRAKQYRNDFINNKNIYVGLYPVDENIERLRKRNNFNYFVFWIYTLLTSVIIIVLLLIVKNVDIVKFINSF